MNLKKAAECIKRNKNFLITTHNNMEGDALGSELAFYRLLKRLRKNAVVINEDDIPDSYSFLPDVDKIQKVRHNLRHIKFDCFAILDCSNLERCGSVSQVDLKGKTILNIDHHISNEDFADVNLVNPKASSASEMVYSLYKYLNVPIDKDTAVLLYVGMLTDTGSFHYSNTTDETHKAVADLLRLKLNITQIYRNIYENVPFNDIRLFIRILPTLKRDTSGKVVWFEIRQNLLKRANISFDLGEHILSVGRSIGDAEVVLLFKENLRTKNEIRVNLRSRGKIDVNKIAAFFGGGGHPTASGCTIKGSIPEVRKKVLARIKKYLK